VYLCTIPILHTVHVHYNLGSKVKQSCWGFWNSFSYKTCGFNFWKFSENFFFQNYFGLSRFHIQYGACLRNFGGSRPAGLGGDRECTDMTVHKPKLKFIYIADLLCRFPLTTFSKKKFKKKIKKKIIKNSKKILNIFRDFFFIFCLAITVPHPIWSMPAKFWGV
jgi:hypothetical protein